MERFEITIVFFAVLFFCTPLLPGDEEESTATEELCVESRSVEVIVKEFMQDSLKFRLEYDFVGGFFDETSGKELLNLCRKTSGELGIMYKRLTQRQAEIEAYEGDDWEKLYGATGLWRMTAQEAERSIWYKSQVDYFLAIASVQDEREKILGDIIQRCQDGNGLFGTTEGELLKAEANAAMGGGIYIQSAKRIVDSILAREDLNEEVYFRGSIIGLKLDESLNRLRVFEIVEDLRQSKSRDDFELNVRLAFLGLKAGWPELLAEVIERWPGAEGFIGRLLLEQMVRECGEGAVVDRSIFEVELAVKAALPGDVSRYKQMILKLSNKEEYRTGLILYVAAASCAESEPIKAVEYYLQSAKARRNEKNCKLQLDAVEIMHEAAELACVLYNKDAEHIDICDRTLKEYFEIAGERTDEGLRYFYAGLLETSGRENQAIGLLNEIVEKDGLYSANARLDLIARELRGDWVNEEAKEKIKRRLKEVIDLAKVRGGRDKVVKRKAMRFYCQLLLERSDEESAHEALSMLEDTELDRCAEEAVLKARALGILGRPDEGVSILANQIDPNDCNMAVEAFSVLSDVVERLEEHLERASDRDVFVNECEAIADYCIRCLDRPLKGNAELIWAELVLSNKPDREKISKIEKILAGQGPGNIAVMRCRAKLLVVKGDFAEAGKIWGQICTARQGIERSEKRNWQWWRAKFNQLYCLSRQQGSKTEETIRSIEVLERSFEDIPVFWAKKLKDLKEDLQK